jgi:hypothetical protein
LENGTMRAWLIARGHLAGASFFGKRISMARDPSTESDFDMLDEPWKADFLLAAMKDAVPIPARVTPHLARAMAKESPGIDLPSQCNIVDVFYFGDPGGIMCRLDIDKPELKNGWIVSLTHLEFRRNVRLSREIEAYRRHRIKKLKQQESSHFYESV